MIPRTRRRTRAGLVAVALAFSVAGCSSSGGDLDDADAMSAKEGTWVDEGNEVEKVVIMIDDDGTTFQAFRDVEATDLYTEGTCVFDEVWTDEAGDTWSLETCTHADGAVYCGLNRISADGLAWDWKHLTTGCPEDLGSAFEHYERAES
jgi:hypothetical protein